MIARAFAFEKETGRSFRRTSSAVLVLATTALLLTTACGGSANDTPNSARPTDADTTTTLEIRSRPEGPAADLSHELTAGDGVVLNQTVPVPADYEEREFAAVGTSTAYRSNGPLSTDGRFRLTAKGSAPYRTRVLVRRPPPEKFNGTVIVEWLLVTDGIDAEPQWRFMADEIARGGYAWVGVSAQQIGVEGGPVAVQIPALGDLPGKGLKVIDPERYGSLEHPGDAYSYDMFTQIARAVRAGAGLGGLTAERLIATGASQSAVLLTTYVDGVQPLTQALDGFVLYGRGGAPAPLGEPGSPIDIGSALTGKPTIIRTDVDVPVLLVATETDLVSVLDYYSARQDDNDRLRLWEVAGAAHANRFVLGPHNEGIDCGVAFNDGPQRFVVAAGLRATDTWIRTGKAPPKAPRLDVELIDGKHVLHRDANGNATGGIRTPQLDVPVATVSGEPGPVPSVLCLLLGSTKPFDAGRLTARYATRQAYLDAYRKAADAAIASGFVVADDRRALLADAQPNRIPN
jgi:hypothetical protein